MVYGTFEIKKGYKKKYPIHKKYHQRNLKTNSWFKIKELSPDKTSPYILSHENTKDTMLISRKVRIVFTEVQRNKIISWFSLYRKVYNFTIKYIKGHFNNNTKFVFSRLRKLVKPFIINLYEVKRKRVGAPAHTIDNAMSDACKAHNSARANLKAGNIKHFRLRLKKSTCNTETIVITKASFLKGKNGFTKIIGEVKSSSSLIGINNDTRLSFNKRKNRFYLHVLENSVIQKKTNKPKVECALDPGVRVFQTVYTKHNCYDIGANTEKDIKPLFEKIDKVSNFQHSKKHKRWHGKYTRRIYDKIKNKVDDLHWKTARFLCERYNEITIGKLSTSRVISKSNNLSRGTRRMCQTLSHFTFRERLEYKCNALGVKYNLTDESYTTKTCGGCGALNNVGRAKVFTCTKCSFTCGRDINGARNIMIKQKH